MTARIVVAEDDVAIRRLVSFTLKRRGYEVLEAASGDVALEVIKEHLPHLVLLDIMMPGMSGMDVGRALHNDPATSKIPFILLSAKGQQAEIAEGLAIGAQAYLVKPFAPSDLVRTVEQALEQAGSSQG